MIVGLAALLAAPVALIEPAAAAVLFSCDSVTGSAVLSPGLVHDPRAQSLSSGPTAPAGPADIVLASTSDTGVKGDDHSFGAALSVDGTKVAFLSQATNLDPADTSFPHDVYVKDLTTGDITLASTSDTGVTGNGPSKDVTLTPDGTKVAFLSSATNLDPADSDSLYDVYVKDLVTGDITLASTSDTGIKANGGSDAAPPDLSDDGTKVAFGSVATNLDAADTDGIADIYVKNLITGNISLVSASDSGMKGNGDSNTGLSLSADARTVAFVSNATNLDPADTNGLRDIYVKDRKTGNITLASTSDNGAIANDGSTTPFLSANGTKVAFSSRASNLDPGDVPTAVQDVFVKDLTTGDIVLVSTSDAGVKATNHSTATALSADGTKVVLNGPGDLDPASANGYPDVYVKNLVTGDITLVSASDTGVDANNFSNFGGSPSADFTRVAFFTTATNLDPADSAFDRNVDVYVKNLPSTPTSVDIAGCTNGQTGTVSVVDIRSYPPRPLGCPTSLGGATGNDYPDTTPILVGPNPRFEIDWASGPNSYGVAAANAGPTPTQWRVRLAITASPGHDTPATNQYLPAAGSGFTKTRLQGKLDVSALDSFNCTSGIDDPLSWLSLANSGRWVAKTG
jgi:hypothetical protein